MGPVRDLPVELVRLGPGGVQSWESAWRALEGRTPDAAPFLCFDWLSQWARTHRPAELAIVVVGPVDAPLGLGLLELRRAGRWRFGGWPVTATRGLLAAPKDEEAVWAGFGAWLREHGDRWSTLQAEGVARTEAGHLLASSTTPSNALVLELPGTFDAYLADRSRDVRRAVRRATRYGAELRRVPDADAEAALADFVRLHQLRATSKGERHAGIGPKLAQMLAALRTAPSVELHLDELVLDHRRIGVNVALGRGAVHWNYNFGVAPDALDLGPGIALQQLSIRNAIERGRRRFDMGPGAFPYKLRAGGVIDDRVDVRVASSSVRGQVIAGLDVSAAVARAVRRRASTRWTEGRRVPARVRRIANLRRS